MTPLLVIAAPVTECMNIHVHYGPQKNFSNFSRNLESSLIKNFIYIWEGMSYEIIFKC